MEKYDIIIIGAGIGGLICGSVLAKSNKKVLIIEQNSNAGGCVTSIKRKNCVFDMGGHLFGNCNTTGILSHCLRELGIKIDFIRVNPTDRFIFKNEEVQVPCEINEYINYLRSKFPREGVNINKFFTKVEYLARNYDNPNVIKKYQMLTYQKMLNAYFHDEKIKSILSAGYLYIGTKPKDASALFMSVLMKSYLHDGIFYPRGGTQAFSDAIHKKFVEYNGVSVFNTLVKKILIEKNSKKAIGVKLANNHEIHSDIVISNADAIKTFFNLVDKDILPRKFLVKLSKYKKCISLFLTFLAIKDFTGDISLARGFHFKSYDMNSDNNGAVYIFIPTIIDPSLAPKNVHVVELITVFPDKLKDAENLIRYKKMFEGRLVKKLSSIVGRIEQNIIYVDSATPKTFERFTLNSDGAAYGWSMTPMQTGWNRLQQETPIKNLFLVGHWTIPGCGITSVAVSGLKLAKKILAQGN